MSTHTDVGSVWRAFAQQSVEGPERIALEIGPIRHSYGELYRRAAAAASQLAMAGAGAGDLVAIRGRRMANTIACMLGAWSLGCAYLAVDVGTPSKRLDMLLNASKPRFLVTPSDDCAGADRPAGHRLRVLTGSRPIGAEVAYVAFTSGTSGTPNGVVISHRSLWNLVTWHIRRFSVGPGQRMAQFAPLAVDASVWEIWPALSAGATLVVVPATYRAAARALPRWYSERAIDIGFAPTLIAEELLQIEWPASPRLGILLTGGEALHRRPNGRFPPILVNAYGPTEATVLATCGTVSPGDSVQSNPSIGREVAGAAVHLLDRDGREVGTGTIGEIWISGPGVACGYVGDEELTKERFQEIRVGGQVVRAYRTGDLAVRQADGAYEFRGRRDRQVKVRGYRVELDEVEAALLHDHRVRRAAVLPDKAGRLRAFVECSAPASPNEILHEVALRLPAYMRPASVMVVRGLPVNSAGKVDLRRVAAIMA